MTRSESTYEFNPAQNAVFARLAGAMTFVAIAMFVPAALLGVAVILLRPVLLAQGVCGVLGVLLVVMSYLHTGAAGHFRRIVTTEGRDVENLMIALGELTSVYELQRWLWIVLGAIVLVALAGTVTGYSP